MLDSQPLIMLDVAWEAFRDIVWCDYLRLSWHMAQYESTAVNDIGNYIKYTD